eukprot:TRINITY_DN18643_c0_g1_i1.p1 TRINITY_DN18643_c0_g1~~TRINITY_DN18643_c0_g1_i1.p1  ORF type:complete len:319 (-),score=63.63 TRINITY_DN18643_c0_g1_i1:32-949(-)
MRAGLVLGLVCLLAGQAAARGGGRTGSDSSRDSYGNHDYGYEDRSYNTYNTYSSGGSESGYGSDYGSYWGTLWVPQWVISWIIFAIIISCCCCCCCFGKNSNRVTVKTTGGQDQGVSRTLSYEGTTPCYLCLDEVANSDWDSGEHRRRCAFNNQSEFLSFPQPYEAYCPNCSERLRLWPAKGHPFYCDECPYERDVLKSSTGENRLNCFFCDFDCCVDCSNAGRFQRARSMSRRPSNTSYMVSDEGINRMGMSNEQPYYPNTQGYNSPPFMNPPQLGPPGYTNSYPQPNQPAFIPSAPPAMNPYQ